MASFKCRPHLTNESVCTPGIYIEMCNLKNRIKWTFFQYSEYCAISRDIVGHFEWRHGAHQCDTESLITWKLRSKHISIFIQNCVYIVRTMIWLTSKSKFLHACVTIAWPNDTFGDQLQRHVASITQKFRVNIDCSLQMLYAVLSNARKTHQNNTDANTSTDHQSSPFVMLYTHGCFY